MSEPTLKGYRASDFQMAAELLTVIEDGVCENCPQANEGLFDAAIDMAITAVCAVANHLIDGGELTVEGRGARVLTYKEIIEGGDRLMWLEILGVKTLLVPTSPYNDNKMNGYSVSFQSGHVQTRGLWSRQWRCWDRKPTEEERNAVPWAYPKKEASE